MLKMPTLCSLAGPLPEKYRRFLNSDGDLQVCGAFWLEAQWILSLVDIGQQNGNYISEDDYTMSESEESREGAGCVVCGDDVTTIDNECNRCRGFLFDSEEQIFEYRMPVGSL